MKIPTDVSVKHVIHLQLSDVCVMDEKDFNGIPRIEYPEWTVVGECKPDGFKMSFSKAMEQLEQIQAKQQWLERAEKFYRELLENWGEFTELI